MNQQFVAISILIFSISLGAKWFWDLYHLGFSHYAQGIDPFRHFAFLVSTLKRHAAAIYESGNVVFYKDGIAVGAWKKNNDSYAFGGTFLIKEQANIVLIWTYTDQNVLFYLYSINENLENESVPYTLVEGLTTQSKIWATEHYVITHDEVMGAYSIFSLEDLSLKFFHQPYTRGMEYIKNQLFAVSKLHVCVSMHSTDSEKFIFDFILKLIDDGSMVHARKMCSNAISKIHEIINLRYVIFVHTETGWLRILLNKVHESEICRSLTDFPVMSLHYVVSGNAVLFNLGGRVVLYRDDGNCVGTTPVLENFLLAGAANIFLVLHWSVSSRLYATVINDMYTRTVEVIGKEELNIGEPTTLSLSSVGYAYIGTSMGHLHMFPIPELN
ncbi:hypothetical protein PCE1_001338 [Barthelona sp. PCE]